MPTGDAVSKLIGEAWRLKIGGEAFFEMLASRFPERSQDLTLLARAERAAARLLAPIADRHGVSIDGEIVVQGVRLHVAALDGDLRQILEESADRGAGCLPLYASLASSLPAYDRRIAEGLEKFERAAIDFMLSILSGDTESEHRRLEKLIGVEPELPTRRASRPMS